MPTGNKCLAAQYGPADRWLPTHSLNQVSQTMGRDRIWGREM